MNLPDLVHLMTFSRGVNIEENRIAKYSQLAERGLMRTLGLTNCVSNLNRRRRPAGVKTRDAIAF